MIHGREHITTPLFMIGFLQRENSDDEEDEKNISY
jgi:hypothetical protein